MRDGGSYDDRMGGVACWNAVMDENDYMVQQVERVHRRVSRDGAAATARRPHAGEGSRVGATAHAACVALHR